MSNKEKYIQEMIDEIEEFIDDGKLSRFTPGKVVLEKDILVTMLEDLRRLVPAELERSRNIVLKKEAILEEAQAKADRIVQNAIKEASEMVEEHEIVKLATKRGNDIEQKAQSQSKEMLGKAREDAREIRLGAMEYTRDMMEGLESYMDSLKEAQTSIYTQLLEGIGGEIEDIHANSKEIKSQIAAVMGGAKEPKKRTIEDFIQPDSKEEK
jgi:cell division septum initiation protein DivIVA